MKIEEAEIILEDLDTLVEIARKNISCTGTWLGLTHSAVALREALEKQIPKEPNDKCEYVKFKSGYCPNCSTSVCGIDKYCPTCGQRLKWE